MKKLFFITVIFLSTVCAKPQLIQTISGGDPLSLGPGTAGFEFQVGAQSLTLRAFGVFDEFDDGVLNDAHAVGLWNANTGALLAKITVAPSSATLLNGYFWANLIVPITLQQGQSYRLGAQYSDVDLDLARGNVTSVVTDSRITMKDAYLSAGSGFDFPDLNVSGANSGFFGPNGSFTQVPEIPHGAMLGAAALLAFAILRRVGKVNRNASSH